MPYDKLKSTSQQILITTKQKLDEIIKLRSERDDLKLSRPTLLEYLASQELKRLKK